MKSLILNPQNVSQTAVAGQSLKDFRHWDLNHFRIEYIGAHLKGLVSEREREKKIAEMVIYRNELNVEVNQIAGSLNGLHQSDVVAVPFRDVLEIFWDIHAIDFHS